ncbi:SUF system Fe-S cluster assembly protein [Rhodopila globiformis]|uniref:SUF system Fe-S cluster assembly protein n=1 Tax=Rhodopila globiformis TaxID=1071 RepID=A0A2S6MYV8_RHOGL|nr:SUF system Fe-S cluster assembly protein [Rhodopila globiformis]
MNEITPPTAWTPDGEKPLQPPAPPSAQTPSAQTPSEDALIEAIATVYDPEIPVNIYELGLIYAIEIADDGAVKVEMTLTAPGCPSAQELPEQVHDAVLTVDGVTSCSVDTVWDPPWDPSRMTEEARLQLNMY